MEEKQFAWTGFYQELADKLVPYGVDRKALIAKIREVFESLGQKLPTLDRGDPEDLDPFTVFALFNKSTMTLDNRKAIVSSMAKAFGTTSPPPDRFDGVPSIFNMQATFYRFKDERGPHDIDRLWDLFHVALAYANNKTDETCNAFATAYDKLKNQKGIKWNITMGLSWIRPYSYLSLDSRSRWFLLESGKMQPSFVSRISNLLDDVPTSSQYLELIKDCEAMFSEGNTPFKSFPDLSYQAWIVSEEVNAQNKRKQAEEQEDATPQEQTSNGIEESEKIETSDDAIRYWLYSPGDGAKYWDEFYDQGIMAIGWDIGDLKSYPTKESMRQEIAGDSAKSSKNAAHATWQFANVMKPGDIVFVKKGFHTIIGRGVVASDYQYDETRPYFKNTRKVRWTDKGEWPHPGQAVMKTLTDITPYTDYVEKLKALFQKEDVEDEDEEPEKTYKPYTVNDFLTDVYMNEAGYDTLAGLVRTKKNVILQGAPGVGKTFVAKRLAWAMMGVQDPERVMLVQFHQSYSYEDFVMGFRPDENGFVLKYGSFYNFCKKAEVDSDNEYFFLIDEINRGNVSKIFGELFMLIENDKRGEEVQLMYANEKFSIPPNVYIIGTMNTADRSLAMMDYALRRRFSFFEIKPAFDNEGFRAYQRSLGSTKFDKLIACVKELNDAIRDDETLGDGFCIGHSYFCNLKEASDAELSRIVTYELIPLLKEYWFDEPQKVRDWSARLRSAIA